MSRVRKSATVAALAISLIGGAEGLRQNAYPDPATRGEPWTICYGHTGNVKPGERKSIAECKALLISDLDKYGDSIERCIKVPVTEARYVALLSLGYNIGSGALCKSSVIRYLNAGQTQEACDSFLKYNRAAGIVFPGLTRRRNAERNLCLAEDSE